MMGSVYPNQPIIATRCWKIGFDVSQFSFDKLDWFNLED